LWPNRPKAFGAERQLVDYLVDGVATVRQIARQVLAEQAVGEKQRADQRQRNAHHPARGFEHKGDEHHADHEVGGGQVAGALNQITFEVPLVERSAHAGDRQYPGQRLPGPAVAACGKAEEHQHQQEPDVACPQHLARHRVKRCHDDLVDGKQQGDIEQCLGPFGWAATQALFLL
jgi:hypothetical protein